MKRFLILFLLTFLLTFFLLTSCESPFTPFSSDKCNGEVEILYVRQAIVNPKGSSPGWATLYHVNYGGFISSSFTKIGKNQWYGTVFLNCDPAPYVIYVIDTTATGVFKPVGSKFFLRPKKEGADWVEINCVVPWENGTAARFNFSNGYIYNATPCNF